MKEFTEISAEAQAIIDGCSQQFVGKDEDAVGVALSVLVATYIARHFSNDDTQTPEYRRATYRLFFQTVARLMPAAQHLMDQVREEQRHKPKGKVN